MKRFTEYITESSAQFTDIIVECNNEILLLRRANYMKRFGGKWCLPGGHIDNQETSKTAILRELKEETNIIINDAMFFTNYKYMSGETSDIYYIILEEKPEVKISREHAQYKWVSRNDIHNYEQKFAGDSYELLKIYMEKK
jgi:mutator protein MutT